ncbi:MAG: hypothetical protein ACTTKH_00110 [Treponema sp.]
MKKALFFCLYFLIFLISVSANNVIELNEGNLKLKAFERTGSFCLYQLSTNGKNNYVPLYDDVAYGHTNKFSVFLDGKIYKLERKLGRPLSIEKVNNTCLITFNIKDKLHIVQRLSFVPDEYGNTAGPLLKIQTTIENTQSKDSNVGLRVIFDTLLGEHNKKAPLATDLRDGIRAETSFNPKMDRDSVIISSNSESACMFFFKHGVDSPQGVYIANWERLNTRKWIPNIVDGRSFNSKYLHDDSACLFVWPTKKLKPTEIMIITTTIGYHDFIRSSKGYNIQSDLSEDEVLPKKVVEPTENMTEEQKKNYDYIQELLNRIHEVEENPDVIPDDVIEELTDQADNAIKDIEGHK